MSEYKKAYVVYDTKSELWFGLSKHSFWKAGVKQLTTGFKTEDELIRHLIKKKYDFIIAQRWVEVYNKHDVLDM